jgi:uncharacterized protein (DUF1697 family)
MPTFVALLRGINVSGKNRLLMADLARCASGLGWGEVRTYLQSGNLVFHAAAESPTGHAASLSGALHREFALELAVLVFTAAELRQVDAATGAAFGVEVDRKFGHATFFQHPLQPAEFAAWKLPAAPGEQAALAPGAKAVLLHLPQGYGRTKLNNTWFERRAGCPATTRNWATLGSLVQMCGEN